MSSQPSLLNPLDYGRPDIVVLACIRNSADVVRDELKEIGDEKRYQTALRVMESQGKAIAKHARELLERYDRGGFGGERLARP